MFLPSAPSCPEFLCTNSKVNYVPVQGGVWWNGGTPECILNLGIRWS